MQSTDRPHSYSYAVSADLMDELKEYFDQRQDVKDGAYGEQVANKEMSLLVQLDLCRPSSPPENGEEIDLQDEDAIVTNLLLNPIEIRRLLRRSLRMESALLYLADTETYEQRIEYIEQALK